MPIHSVSIARASDSPSHPQAFAGVWPQLRWLLLALVLGLALLLASRPAAAQSALDALAPNLDGEVYAALVQPDGKIVLGGTFTTVAGTARGRIARLNADGSLDSGFNPNANSTVRSLALLADGAIAAGGEFTDIGGQARNRIAVLDAVSGQATAFNPNANGSVFRIAVGGSTLFVGGAFTSIGGQTRNRIAAVDTATGLATAFNPNANNVVSSIALSGNTLFVGGAFTSIGGQARNRIAAIDAATGLATAFNPNASGMVSSIAVGGSTLFVGGAFTGIGGQSRNRIAAIDAATGLATAFNPDADNTVDSLALQVDGRVLVAGSFGTIGGQPRARLARLDASTGAADAFAPAVDGAVSSLVLQPNGKLLAGGGFATVDGQTRNRLARFGVPDAPADLAANVGNQSAALSWSGSTVPGYAVQVAPDVGGSSVACTTAGTLGCTVTGLGNGSSYVFAVTASNMMGTSSASATVTVTPQALIGMNLPLPGVAGTASVSIAGAPPGCLVVPGSAQVTNTALPGAPAGASFPAGVFRFEATGCANATLTVDIRYPQALAPGVLLRKYGPPSFLAPDALFTPPGASVSGDRRTVSFQVTDNGAGDGNTALGEIRDPFAPMLLAGGTIAPVPAQGPWGAWLLSGLLALAALAVLRRRAH